MKSEAAIKDRIRDLELAYSTNLARARKAEEEELEEEIVQKYLNLCSFNISEIRGLRWVLEENYLDGSYSYDMVTNTHIHTFKEGTKVNVLTGEKL